MRERSAQPHRSVAWHYLVAVYAPDGSTYWMSTVDGTSLHVGGDPVLETARPGPSIIAGMSWRVVGLDEDYVPVALSDRQPINP